MPFEPPVMPPIVLLAGPGPFTNILYNSLSSSFRVLKVVLEEPVPATQVVLRRVRVLGAAKVAGQLLFRAGAVPLLNLASRRRRAEIKRFWGLDDSPIEEKMLLRVPSVNSGAAREFLANTAPRVVVVQGTRIISEETLAAAGARFINMHAGITPLYRGVHGGYWALVEKNRKACGVTVHFIDRGIDTGGVIEQGLIEPGPRDNYATYPLLQMAAGLPLLKKAVAAALDGKAEARPGPPGNSKLWSHPTLFEYLRHRIVQGVG